MCAAVSAAHLAGFSIERPASSAFPSARGLLVSCAIWRLRLVDSVRSHLLDLLDSMSAGLNKSARKVYILAIDLFVQK